MDIPRALEHFAAAERLLTAPAAVFHLHRGRCQAAMFGLRTALLVESAAHIEAIAASAGPAGSGRGRGLGAGVGRGEPGTAQRRRGDLGAELEHRSRAG